MLDLKEALERYFGYKSFRQPQEEIIRTLLEGKNVMVIMPTGAGKSLCYQLPALLLPGTALVVSPLIALMKNQVDQMQAYDIPAAFLNSSLSRREYEEVKRACLQGKVKLLYVAPETLLSESFAEVLAQLQISFVAVDEAHCISEWGHDFRPEYRRIRHALRDLPPMPIIALTATATPRVQRDILENLEILDAVVFRTSFNRPNLYYQITPKRSHQATLKEIVQYIRSRPGQAGIVYCHSRRRVEDVANILQANGIKALPYHAGMDAATRTRNQDAFLNEEIQVIVATIAFGMGIDKPDVRFVIHFDVPKSIENYYQETGRAGRDGLPADCILYYDYNDILKLDRFLKDKPASEREAIVFLLQEMAYFCETGQCRRKFLLQYFGESYDTHKCNGMCDNCRYPKQSIEGKDIALPILQALLQAEEYPLTPILDHVAGLQPEIAGRALPTFGALKGHKLDDLKAYAVQLLVEGYIERHPSDYSVVRLTEKGKAFVQNPHPIPLYPPYDRNYTPTETEPTEELHLHNEELLAQLKNLRKKLAQEYQVPPYVIFQEPTLIEMATYFPFTVEELERIAGVGPVKARKYGPPFLELIRSFVEENEIERPLELIIPTPQKRQTEWVEIIQSIDHRIPLPTLARRLNLTLEELIEKIEHLVLRMGIRVKLDYAIQSMLPPDRVEEAFDYFYEAEDDDIEKAMDALNGEYTYEELRLLRLHFHLTVG
uniref:DNA helicase RecQ n=1 Tax=uncultured Bacteroidota bacterium TaxID=152509 RepID=H5SK29_9BACT|nr:ATP-dependent DNA helicase RecQ [uncultured Bacteroidetes bacterium]